jgi:hypothetical protein
MLESTRSLVTTFSAPIYVIGDIHGQYEKMVGLLRGAGLIGADLAWSGGSAQLWFMGDFFDRGPDGIAVVDLVMRLQAEAATAGGRVESLLGNHEPLLLAARRFGERPTAWGGSFISDWRRNGGVEADLVGLTPSQIAWLLDLPAMALVDDRLLVHADSTLYTSYGSTIDEVNQSFRALLRGDDQAAWDQLLEQFADRLAFDVRDADGAMGEAHILSDFGWRQLIHGNTTISYMNKAAAEDVTGPLVYAGGRCVNVDGGMYMGGPGFIYQL